MNSCEHSALLCVVMHAGNEIMLVLEARAGRFPVEVCVTTGSMIGWTCADEKFEFIELKSEQGIADHLVLVQQIANDGLLVAEVGDIACPDVELAKYALMERRGRAASAEEMPSCQA